MTDLQRPSPFPSPFSGGSLRRPHSPLKTFLLGIAVAVLAGCASTSPPGMPGDPVLTTASAAGPALTPVYPNGPLAPLARAQAASDAVAQLEPPSDLWVRIRSGFSMPDLQNELVTDREQWYASRPDYIQRMTE